MSKAISPEILKELREGIMDEDFNKKRHLLTAKELLDQVNDYLPSDTNIGLSKLYYHLEKLEETNLIDHLAVVKGRRA